MDTLVSRYVKARTTNETSAVFASKIATATAPSGEGVIPLRVVGEFTRGSIMLIPYGEGADNSTLSARVIGWRQVAALWVPVILSEIAVTLSTAVGVSGQAVLDTERFGDTVSLSLGNAGVDNQIFSPANNTPAHVVIDAKGATAIEVIFARGTATSCNALVAYL